MASPPIRSSAAPGGYSFQSNIVQHARRVGEIRGFSAGAERPLDGRRLGEPI
jgi:hypothetical protein